MGTKRRRTPALDPASLSKFNGHTPRQHRASASKGGKVRMRSVTREQQIAWGRLGGLASQARIRAQREAEARAADTIVDRLNNEDRHD